jgi:flagellar biosynthetic protein FliR
MFEIYHFSQLEILAFLLVLARISAFFVTWPVLSMGHVPGFAKILFSFAVALVMFPLVAWNKLDQRTVEDLYIFLLMKEAFVGVVLGFTTRIFFFAIESCGHMAADAMGLTSAQVLDPMVESRTSVIEQFYTIFVTMFYLLINGHHYFVSGLFKSFEMVPVNGLGVSLLSLGQSGEFLQSIFVIALKLAAPIVVSIFAMNIALGVIGRAVPQMNVLITSLSVNILLGLFLMFISLPLVLDSLPGFLNQTLEGVFAVLKAF